MAVLHRLFRHDAPPVSFTLDGAPCEGRAGDTVLTAILMQMDSLRTSEFTGEARAGFCQMGACQDCWVTLESGERLRACSTPLAEGMRILTRVWR